ncbi:MAG: SDR family oxidoreductase [Isosphaeraceae bacterium]
MSTLIVGAGYLGRRVSRILRARGEHIWGTTRSADRSDSLRKWGAEPLVLDVLDPEVSAIPLDVDRILFCVGYDRGSGADVASVHVAGLRGVLNALGGRTCRVVYTSSTSVFGKGDGGWVTEDSPTEPLTDSGRACLDAEQLLRTWSDERIDGCVVRYSGLYGPGRVVGRQALERGDPIAGEPDRYLNWLHIDDAAAAAVAVLDHGVRGEVYLASDDQPLLRRDYYERLARFLGTSPPKFNPADTSARSYEGHRRVQNRRIKQELGLVLRYPSVDSGLPAALASEE